MPLNIEEFVIQACFEDEAAPDKPQAAMTEANTLKEDIVHECMEKLEEYLRRRENR
jgi:hypothetical protein